VHTKGTNIYFLIICIFGVINVYIFLYNKLGQTLKSLIENKTRITCFLGSGVSIRYPYDKNLREAECSVEFAG
jgi:hypothetical protein